MNYEARLTLFIDFLGFKETVEATVNNSEALAHLVETISDATREANSGDRADFHATQFSDCLVISYSLKPDALFVMVNKLSLMLISITYRGYLIRGGLTYGKLLHNDSSLLGPAMNRAYQLESEIAKWPRVILDPEVFNNLLSSPSSDELKTVKKFLKRDGIDGLWYFDYISAETVSGIVSGEYEFYPEYLATIADMIKKGLKNQSPGVLAKYIWLYERYNEARNPFLGQVDNRPEFSDFYAAIEELPSLNKSVAAAREVVTKASKNKEAKTRKW